MKNRATKAAYITAGIVALVPASQIAIEAGRSTLIAGASTIGLLGYVTSKIYNLTVDRHNQAELTANPNSTNLRSPSPTQLQRRLGQAALVSPALVYGGMAAETAANLAFPTAVSATIILAGGAALLTKAKEPRR